MKVTNGQVWAKPLSQHQITLLAQPETNSALSTRLRQGQSGQFHVFRFDRHAEPRRVKRQPSQTRLTPVWPNTVHSFAHHQQAYNTILRSIYNLEAIFQEVNMEAYFDFMCPCKMPPFTETKHCTSRTYLSICQDLQMAVVVFLQCCTLVIISKIV